MGPKRQSPLEDPPAASSSSEEEEEDEVSDTGNQVDEQKEEEPEEEEEEEDDDDEEESEDEEQEKSFSQNDKKLTTLGNKLPEKKPQPEESSSDDESESEPETEKIIKPIATKPMETKKPAPKPSKRPIESSPDEKISKKSKTKESPATENDKKTGEESSKKLFQRLWSEEDEIAVLKGMIDYDSKKGLDPMSDVSGFYEFVKRFLDVEVTKKQVLNKVKRLRKKYSNNFGRGKEGKDPNFTRPHESKSYQLSKKIWGDISQDVDLANKSSNGKLSKSPSKEKKPNVKEEAEKAKKTNVKNEGEKQVVGVKDDEDIVMTDVAGDFCITELVKEGLNEVIVRQGLESLSHAKKAELEEKWRGLKLAESEFFMKRIGLLQDHSKLIMDAYKSSRR